MADDQRQHDEVGGRPGPSATTDIEVVLPVYNEEHQLETGVRRLRSFLDRSFPLRAVVTIADNASTDGTWPIACRLAQTVPGVQAVRVEQKGRGRALRAVWSRSEASVVAYMDIDLSTGLDALLPLVAPLISGHSDIAVGTRLAAGSHVVRGPRRELISRAYNALVRLLLRTHFSDAQCGFKAVRGDVARSLLPGIANDEWFFDTELLVLAERSGLRIHEVPVDWVDDPDSHVDVVRTSLEDLRGIARLLGSVARGDGRVVVIPVATRSDADAEVVCFAGIGLASTVAALGLFMAFRAALGPFGANAVALAICTAANTWAHRRITYADRGPLPMRRQIAGVVGLFAVSLLVTTGFLTAVVLGGMGSVPVELAALLVGNAVAAVVRFAVLRLWLFRARLGSTRPGLRAAVPTPPVPSFPSARSDQ